MSKPTAAEDPLKEPLNARSRLRRVRQEEAAARYAATYEQRVGGGIASVRKTPNSNVTVEASLNTPASGDGYYLGASSPRGRSSYTTTAANTLSSAAVMEGRAVNVAGQTLDGPATAISRLLHGDFYTVRGPTVHELQQRKEGKYMRFRAESASRPPHCDVVAPAHDAATMTRQTKTQTLAKQKKGHPRPTGTNPYERGPQYGPHDDYYLYDGGLNATGSVFDRSNRAASAGGRRPGTDSSARTRALRNGDNHHVGHPVSEEDDVRYMEPLNLDRVFAEAPSQRSINTRRGIPGSATSSRARGDSAGRCGSASKRPLASYRGPTASYQKKVESNAEIRLRKHQDAAEAEQQKRQWAAGAAQVKHQQQALASRQAYDTALQHQNQHPSGQAAILSNDELRKIMTLVDKPRLYQAGAQRTSGYHPRDNEGILS